MDNLKMQEQVLVNKFMEMLKEDAAYDVTTAFAPVKNVRAKIIAKEEGIISGIEELSVLFRMSCIKASPKVSDGEKVKAGKVLFTLEGGSGDVLKVERTALNILSRMSGISTLTRRTVELVKKTNPDVRVAATRKVTPLFGFFEKKAVKVGGGDTHRMNLGDAVMIKDNHLKLFKDVKSALQIARRETSFVHKIEIEVSSMKDAIAAAEGGADIIMLDNMPPQKIREVEKKLAEKGLRQRVILEASGGIDESNIADYAASGVDVVSMGALTHSVKGLDVSLKIQ